MCTIMSKMGHLSLSLSQSLSGSTLPAKACCGGLLTKWTKFPPAETAAAASKYPGEVAWGHGTTPGPGGCW